MTGKARQARAKTGGDVFAAPSTGEPDRATTPTSGIRVGIGGWVYAPWRDNFYPKGLVQRRELEFASRHVTTIEINGTYYGTQKPETYARWAAETAEGFVFSAKAPMRIMQSKVLAKTGPQVQDFVGGIVSLGDRLGPLVWQFDNGPKLQREDFSAFLALLPTTANGHRLRHVLDVRDRDFVDEEFIALARRHGMATVFTDSDEHPSFADVTADFVYARLMQTRTEVATGYPAVELDRWAQRARNWASGGQPEGLPYISADTAPSVPREVFVYFISSAKERNPAAAMALLQRLVD